MIRMIFSSSILKILSMIIGFVILTVTARGLGAVGRGEFATLTTWAGSVAIVCSLSLGQIAISRKRLESSAWVDEALPILSIYLLIVFLFQILAVFVLKYFSNVDLIFLDNYFYIFFVTFYALALLWESFVEPIFSGLGKIVFFNKVKFVSQVLLLILISLLYFTDKLKIVSLLWSQLIVSLICVFICSLSLIKEGLKLEIPKLVTFKKYLKNGSHLHLGVVATYIFTSSDVLMINYFLGNFDTGNYQLAVALINFLLVIPQTVRIVLLGGLNQADLSSNWKTHKKLIIYTTSIMVFAAIIAYFLCVPIISYFMGSEFYDSIDIYRLLLLGVVMSSFSASISPQWILRGMFLQVSLVSLMAAVLNLFLNYLLIPIYGVKGAVWSSLSSWFLVALINVILYLYCDRDAKAST